MMRYRKVLANVVDFEIFFENDGNKLDIFIKHPKHDPRPIEMGSGAEKTIAAMAIRLALLSVSSLPKIQPLYPSMSQQRRSMQKIWKALSAL